MSQTGRKYELNGANRTQNIHSCKTTETTSSKEPLTPTKADNKIVNILLKVLNILAGNVLKNKNADN